MLFFDPYVPCSPLNFVTWDFNNTFMKLISVYIAYSYFISMYFKAHCFFDDDINNNNKYRIRVQYKSAKNITLGDS